MALHLFVAGESAQVAENLDNNFLYLLGLIQGGARFVSSGTSTFSAVGGVSLGSSPNISGSTLVNFQSGSLAGRQAVANAVGSSVVSFVSQTVANSIVSVTGTGTFQAFAAGALVRPAILTAAGNTATSLVAGGAFAGTMVSTGSTVTSLFGGATLPSRATMTGSTLTSLVALQGATESASGSAFSQLGQQLIASTTPGSPATTFNMFSFLFSPPSPLNYNNSVDSGIFSNIVMLYYLNHVVYAWRATNNWYQWTAPLTWVSTASPLPAAPIRESLEGTIVTTANPSSTNTPGAIIYASSVPGVAPAAGATVGNGLDTWALTANPGLVIRNGVIDNNTAAVTELSYTNHTLSQFGNGAWYDWKINGPDNGYQFNPNGPIPATPTISINPIANQIIYAAFLVSGTYEGFTGVGNPSLEFADNGGATFAAIPSPVFSLAGTVGAATVVNWSFVHLGTNATSAAYSVMVRDAAATGTSAFTNSFQVSTPGVVTLQSITMGGQTSGTLTAVAGPSGTVVEPIVVATAGGAFSGAVTVTGTNSNLFTSPTGTTLVTTQVVAPGTYGPLNLVASQTGAANSPLTAGPYTIVLLAESANQTLVNSVGPSIAGSATPGTAGSTLAWGLVAATTNFRVRLNGVNQTATAVANNIASIYYINHTLYVLNGAGAWFAFSGTVAGGQATFLSSNSPLPVITLTNIEQGAGLTTYNGQVSVVVGGTGTDNFVATPGTSQLFTIQTFVAAVPLSFAAGPSSYTVTVGSAQFFVTSNTTSWFLNGNGALPAGTYPVTVQATY